MQRYYMHDTIGILIAFLIQLFPSMNHYHTIKLNFLSHSAQDLSQNYLYYKRISTIIAWCAVFHGLNELPGLKWKLSVSRSRASKYECNLRNPTNQTSLSWARSAGECALWALFYLVIPKTFNFRWIFGNYKLNNDVWKITFDFKVIFKIHSLKSTKSF